VCVPGRGAAKSHAIEGKLTKKARNKELKCKELLRIGMEIGFCPIRKI
jgi:hypothetical protein